MARGLLALLVALASLTGCAARATLPYAPAVQPAGVTLSAAYAVSSDRLRIEIDTDGRRLEQAGILAADGAEIPAQTIEHFPAAPYGGSSPVGVGIGIGGGSWGGRGGVGVGTGVSVGIPVGGGGGGGNTVAWFPLAQAGPPPWRLRVKVAGVEPAVIVVGDAP
jgi:hypothetical protein